LTGSVDARSFTARSQPSGAAMKGFVDDIEQLTEDNTDFRRVLYTGKHLQLVLLALQPGELMGL
jgi:hypothetical protein